MEFSIRQWIALLLMIIVDAIVAVIFALTLGPFWVEPHADLLIPNLNLIMSPLAAIAILLVPTLFFLWIGWPDKLKIEMFLLPLRLGFAYEFLHGGLEKIFSTTYLSSSGLIGLGATAAPSPWIRGFMNLLLPNATAFLLLIAWGELLVGVSLLTGGFTRLGALGGWLLQSSFLFLLGWLSLSTFGVNFLGSIAFFVVGFYRSGRYLGLDQFWGPTFDKSENPIMKFLGWWT